MLCGFFSVTLQLWRDRAVESKGSLVIIILLLLHSSPDGPHLSIPPPSLSASLFPHIPVFISFPSLPDFVSLGSRQERRKGDSQKHREIERKEKMTRIRWKQTEGCKQKEESKGREGLYFLTSESLCNHWTLLVTAKCLWSANTQWKYVTVILFPFIIPCSASSPSSHFFTWPVNIPLLSLSSLFLPILPCLVLL